MSIPAIPSAHPYTTKIEISPGAYAAIEDRITPGDAWLRTREAMYYHLEREGTSLQLGQTVSVIVAHFGSVHRPATGPAPLRLKVRCVAHGEVLLMTPEEARTLPAPLMVGGEVIYLHADEE